MSRANRRRERRVGEGPQPAPFRRLHNFFGSPHTMQRYETAFYSPLVSDWRNFETWAQDGATDASTRAHAIWRRLLEQSESPVLESDIDQALTEFVARRKEALR